jgi:hypothetical protein
MGWTMAEIVKVQIPLNGPGPALVYDRERRVCFIENLTPAAQEAMGDAPKAFFDAEWTSGMWVLRHRVEDQDW